MAKSALPRCTDAMGTPSTVPLRVPMQMCDPAASIAVGAPSLWNSARNGSGNERPGPHVHVNMHGLCMTSTQEAAPCSDHTDVLRSLVFTPNLDEVNAEGCFLL